MKIIVGLGNPGLRYRNTRHNVGFMVLKHLSKKYRISIKKKGFHGVYGAGNIKGQEVLLFEPLTYMNLSGNAVKAISSCHLKNREDLLVISDDLNLDLGTIRVRRQGSAGGHNGLKSIIGFFGTEFARLRVGIATEQGPKGDVSGFVLGGFKRKNVAALNSAIERASECVEIWLSEGIREAMNSCN